MNDGEQEPRRITRGQVEASISIRYKTPCGDLYVNCSHRDGKPIELFIATRKLNPQKQLQCGWGLNVTAIGCSRLLQAGEGKNEVAKFANGVRCPMWSLNGMPTCPEHMAQTILDSDKYVPGEVVEVQEPAQVSEAVETPVPEPPKKQFTFHPTPAREEPLAPGPVTDVTLCPDCGMKLVMEGGCDKCPHCGYSTCS